ncbi:MAG: 4-hydroxy-tetrahydrodipicolinate reductase [bacterium]
MTENKIAVVIAGCGGRMGRTILKLIKESSGFELSGALESPGSSLIGHPVSELSGEQSDSMLIRADIAEVLSGGEVVIDFTRPEGTRKIAKAVRDGSAALVTGTTGLSADDEALLKEVAARTTVVYSANMSAGINLLAGLVEQTAKCLGDDFDVEIVEMHHRFKEDAPSGTARLLADRVAAVKDRALDEIKKTGRDGFVGERDSDEIGMFALRGGDVVGDHTVIFAGIGERIELTHRASSRETFAHGALRAAHFASESEPGFYTMTDVLGLQ